MCGADGVFSETFDDKNPSEESDVAFISSSEVTESEEGSNHVELEALVETSKPKEDFTPSKEISFPLKEHYRIGLCLQNSC